MSSKNKPDLRRFRGIAPTDTDMLRWLLYDIERLELLIQKNHNELIEAIKIQEERINEIAHTKIENKPA